MLAIDLLIGLPMVTYSLVLQVEALAALLDKTNKGEWVTIGQPMSGSLPILASLDLLLELRKWFVDRPQAVVTV